MIEHRLEITDLDRRIWEEELADFLPEQLYDAHVHVYDPTHCTSTTDDEPTEGVTWWERPVHLMDRTALDACYDTLYPGRRLNYLMMGWVYRRGDWDAANEFTAAQTADDPRSVAFMLTPAAFDARHVAETVDRLGFRGLKPYRWWADDENECRITDMLPEPLIEVANDRDLVVMMHLGKSRAIADEENLADLERLTRQYPRVKWILAHLARCLVAWPLEEAAPRLRDIPNIWFDFSSVTSTDVFMAALRNFPHDRIMYGSDFPVDLMKGQYIGWGKAWAHLTEDMIKQMGITHCDPRPTFIGYEMLRGARRAMLNLDLDRSTVEDIFYHNAVRLLGINH